MKAVLALTTPLLYVCIFPMLLVDLVISIYHLVCFPIYGIPYVRRRDHFIFDRVFLPYLNLRDRIHCAYCSYANGLFAYLADIAARTEQRFCPIKHSRPPKFQHARYELFFDYGDAERYRRNVEFMCHDFEDLMEPRHRIEARPLLNRSA